MVRHRHVVDGSFPSESPERSLVSRLGPLWSQSAERSEALASLAKALLERQAVTPVFEWPRDLREIRRMNNNGHIQSPKTWDALGSGPLLKAAPIELDNVPITVVIPVYNEVRTIGEVIRRALECGHETEVIVVDDGSTDGTSEYLKQFQHLKVRCSFHTVNRGKGGSFTNRLFRDDQPVRFRSRR